MHRNVMAALAVAVLLAGSVTACTPTPIVSIPSVSQTPGEIALTVGIPQVPDGVDPQEGVLLAEVYAAALKAAGVKVAVASSPVEPGALVSDVEKGAADMVPVYSRIALSEVSPNDTAVGANEVLDVLKAGLPSGLGLLDPAKAEDRDGIVVTAVTAQKYQLKSLSDVGQVCDKLTMGGSAEFKTKVRGLSGLGSNYNCVPKAYESLEPTVAFEPQSTLWALLRDDIQMAGIHSSSPAIEDNALVVLNDPKDLFASQNILPLVSTSKVPEVLQGVLNKVSAAISAEELRNLNRLAQDRHYTDLSQVATAWLIQNGLIKANS